MTDNSLAIVIPAYKTKYFDAALSSISLQANKNFKVYVCDDGSRDDIKSIADKYADQIAIEYVRFDNNLGKTDLVAHWNRSVERANEEWVWFFSDDDIMSPGCTQAFFDALRSTSAQCDLYRFNIEMIDAGGQVICVKDPHPLAETGYEFLLRRLQSKSLSAAVEYIFRKDIFKQNNGFVNFPMAYCSDDASWIQFAGDKPIYTIATEKVYWRSSGINISSAKGFQDQKAEALLQFVVFVLSKFGSTGGLLPMLERWFYENLNYIPGRLSFRLAIKLSGKLDAIFKNGSPALKKVIASQLRNTRFAAVVGKWSEY